MKRLLLHLILGLLCLGTLRAQVTTAGSPAILSGGSSGSGSGTVNTGTTPQLAYYASTGTAVSPATQSTAGVAAYEVRNTSASASAFTEFHVGNDTSAAQVFLGTESSANVGAPGGANSGYLGVTGSNVFVFYAGGAVKASFTGGGGFKIGTLTVGTSMSNVRHGITGALSSGTLVVADAGATANTRYFFTTHALGTVTLPQAYYASARSAGVSFTITSGNVTDTSTVDWLAIEP